MARQSPRASSKISPATALCAVVLHPAAHTRSPAMHNAAFAALGLDAVYLAFDVAPADLGDAIRGARAVGVRQLAISIPHKLAVAEYLDEIDETARAIGAVNTVTREDGRLIGSNTDWLGATRALERHGQLAGKRAVVLGAGGTARAVVYGLLRRGASVTILNRSEAKAVELARALGAEAGGGLESLAGIDHDVLVNTTSVGLGDAAATPVSGSALRADSLVLDAVYDPEQTRLLREAGAAGATADGGKWMLVQQAAEQLERWAGREAPIEVMAEAFDHA